MRRLAGGVSLWWRWLRGLPLFIYIMKAAAHTPKFGSRWKAHLRKRSGFTLLELLIVVLVMSLLAAITIGSMQYAKKKASRSRTEAFIELIKTQLTQYKLDYGDYPKLTDPQFGTSTMANDTEDIGGGGHPKLGGAVLLYRALTGDIDDDGIIGSSETLKLPLVQLISEKGDASSDFRVKRSSVNGYYYLCDAYETPIQYRHGGDTGAINQDSYDLWSPVDSGDYNDAPTGSGSYPKWIKNW